MSFTSFLKEVSQDTHDQLEETPLVLKLLSEDLDVQTYESWLYLTWALHDFCLEEAGDQKEGLCFLDLRLKHDWLTSDLSSKLKSFPKLSFPRPSNLAEYLSLLYTVEGSAMGVHAIYQRLERNGSLEKLEKIKFLRNQVKISPRNWKEDKRLLDACANGQEEARDYLLQLFEAIKRASLNLLN